jgi:hypothetical protein
VSTSTETSATYTLSASELQSSDPKRFQKEYSKWAEYALDYDWWDGIEENFKHDVAAEGITVERIYFNLSYSQGDYASFEGQINVAEWMEAKGYDETYPALYLAVKDYGEYASVSDRTNRGGWPRVNFDGTCVGNTEPAGIFAGLENEDWDELVCEQHDAAGIEDELQSTVEAMCRKLYSDLQAECEHLTSEESFIESCECNDVTFEIEDEECEA